MSRNKYADYTQYIHKFYDEILHQERFAVAVKLPNGEYYRPADTRETASWGIKEFNSFDIRLMGALPTRKQALRRARYLFGGK